MTITRRQFTLSAMALAAAAATPAHAQDSTKSITTSLGTYDVPLNPQRVIAIDHRLDLEPALALGLTVLGYSLSDDLASWVPAGDASFIGAPPTQELVLAQNPDLIFCTDIPGSELWPSDKLKDVAPVIPIDYEMDWKGNLRRAGEWLDRSDAADAFIADYDSRLAALREQRGEQIGTATVAGVWYEPDAGTVQFLFGVDSINVTLAGQVLADLGGTTISQEGLGQYGDAAIERVVDLLQDVDAILLDNGGDISVSDQLTAHPLWQRVPAVAAGRVLVTEGAYYGGGFSAKRLIGEWDKVYALL